MGPMKAYVEFVDKKLRTAGTLFSIDVAVGALFRGEYFTTVCDPGCVDLIHLGTPGAQQPEHVSIMGDVNGYKSAGHPGGYMPTRPFAVYLCDSGEKWTFDTVEPGKTLRLTLRARREIANFSCQFHGRAVLSGEEAAAVDITRESKLPKVDPHEQAHITRAGMCNNVYRHFKGGKYLVSNVAVDEATGDLIVIYFNLAEPSKVWARPFFAFVEEVEVTECGRKIRVPRFQLVRE